MHANIYMCEFLRREHLIPSTSVYLILLPLEFELAIDVRIFFSLLVCMLWLFDLSNPSFGNISWVDKLVGLYIVNK